MNYLCIWLTCAGLFACGLALGVLMGLMIRNGQPS